MATLHLIQSSPYQSTAFLHCLEQLHPEDGILFFENGVYAATTHYQQSITIASAHRFALKADLSARGINAAKSITVIDYRAFVNLIAQFDNSLTWN